LIAEGDEVLVISHFLSKDISDIGCPWDMLDREKLRGDAFPDAIFPDLDEAGAFGGGGFAPIDTGAVVVIEGDRYGGRKERMKVIEILEADGQLDE
jgi:hypothetical protein